ncbi:orotidine-5'-phosphate decarboxylase [Candidatus Kaiserbacteria bacterium]|nr:orotidine-5'-phosphate decarboxylase [Candidatus Kaiserbacteria bacterium]
MRHRHFGELIRAKWNEGKHVCAGVDINVDMFPGDDGKERCFEHITSLIDKTRDLVCAYKFNFAPFLTFGHHCFSLLRNSTAHITCVADDVPMILDGKFGDIGKTNTHYARFAFDYLRFDALTVSAYPGLGALEPFFAYADKGIFVLCKTSNPESGEFQDECDQNGVPLYQKLAAHLGTHHNTHRNCGLVVGATYPDVIEHVRDTVPDIPFLIPGVGPQGGDLTSTIYAADRRFMINISIAESHDPRATIVDVDQQIRSILE